MQEAVFPPQLAVISVSPLEIPITLPLLSTVAISGFLLFHVILVMLSAGCTKASKEMSSFSSTLNSPAFISTDITSFGSTLAFFALRTHFSASIKPYPLYLLNSDSFDAHIIFLTCCGVKLGFASNISDATAATTGDAIEVPVILMYLPPGTVLTTSTPGAKISNVSP